MREELPQNNHPLNQRAKKYLKDPDPSMLYCLQLVEEQWEAGKVPLNNVRGQYVYPFFEEMAGREPKRAWSLLQRDGDLADQRELPTISADDLAWRVVDHLTSMLEAANY
jgi:hypothetical protein